MNGVARLVMLFTTGMLIGSVSHFCVQHADCPVVVFRDDKG